ncbi:MAG: RNA polymerase sigma factor [Polyangiales bacterium]
MQLVAANAAFPIPCVGYFMGDATAIEGSEEELIQRAKTGDRAAFGILVRAHQGRTFGLAVRMLGARSEAEDAVQETYLRAWRALRYYDGRAALSTWLHRICVNVCLNIIRRRRRSKHQAVEDIRLPALDGPDPAAAAESRRRFQVVAAAVDGLSPSLRSTAVLVLLEGASLAEAAEVLGCPEGTVAWRIHEARRKLREAVRAAGEDIGGEGS